MKSSLTTPLASCFLLCLLPFLMSAQVIRENAEGEKIIVYPDGHAEYFNGEPVEGYEGEETASYPVFTGYIEPLDGSIAVNQEDLFKIAQRRSQLAEEAAAIAERRATEAERNLTRLETQLAATPANPDDPVYQALEHQLAAARRAVEQTKIEAREAVSLAREAETLTAKGGFVERFNENRRRHRAVAEQQNIALTAADLPYSSLIPFTDNYLANNRQDLLRQPPPPGCDFAFEGADQSSGQYRRDIDANLLFTFTDERLRPYLGGKEYLSCEGFLSSVGGYRYLTLTFTFAYPNAREAYGFIDQNSVLTIKMLNGDFVNLRAGEMARGSYDTVKEELTYQVRYPIDRGLLASLKNSEVDMLRVFWSSGFEEYQIHQMDFFQHQLECLGD
jgi:hypothetical protein